MVILLKIQHTWRWFYDHEASQFMLWAPVLLGIGIGLYFTEFPEQPLYFSFSITVLASLISITARYYAYLYRHLLYAVTLVCCGYCLIQYASHRIESSAINQSLNQSLDQSLDQSLTKKIIRGTVDHIESRPGDWRITLKHIEFIDRTIKDEDPSINKMAIESLNKVRVVHKVKQPSMRNLKPGARVKVVVTLNPPKPPAFPGAYDLRRQAYFNGISATGFTHSKFEKLSTYPTSLWQRCRHQLTQFFESNLSTPQGSIAAALTTGERSGIPSQLRDQYADAGIAHILAISGLHVSIIAGLVFFVFRRLLSLWFVVAMRYDIKKLAAVLSLGMTFCYLQLSGCGYPALRSFIMTSIVIIGIVVDRPAVTLRNVAIASLFILITTPQALISPSFQLSFSAVVALVAFYEKTQGAQWSLRSSNVPGYVRKVVNYFLGLVLSSLIATAATIPYTIYTFHRFTLAALLSNLLAIPLISFIIMPMLLVFIVCARFYQVHDLAELLNLCIALMNRIAEYFSNLPLANIKVGQFSGSSLGILTIGFLWVLFWKTRIKWIGLFIVLVGMVKIKYYEPHPQLFINAQKTLICYYDGQKGFVNTRQKARFERTQWQDAFGLTQVDKPLPWDINQLSKKLMSQHQAAMGLFIWLPENRYQYAYQYSRPWNRELMKPLVKL